MRQLHKKSGGKAEFVSDLFEANLLDAEVYGHDENFSVVKAVFGVFEDAGKLGGGPCRY